MKKATSLGTLFDLRTECVYALMIFSHRLEKIRYFLTSNGKDLRSKPELKLPLSVTT